MNRQHLKQSIDNLTRQYIAMRQAMSEKTRIMKDVREGHRNLTEKIPLGYMILDEGSINFTKRRLVNLLIEYNVTYLGMSFEEAVAQTMNTVEEIDNKYSIRKITRPPATTRRHLTKSRTKKDDDDEDDGPGVAGISRQLFAYGKKKNKKL